MKITERTPTRGRGIWAVIVEADEGKRLYILPDQTGPKRIQIIETTDPPPEWIERDLIEKYRKVRKGQREQRKGTCM